MTDVIAFFPGSRGLLTSSSAGADCSMIATKPASYNVAASERDMAYVV